jgi:hypothetical protein
MDIIEFLRARYDEDEQIATAASTPGHWGPSGHSVLTSDDIEIIEASRADSVHIARHDPARALREIEAHRSIVALYEALNDHPMRSDTAFHWQRLAMKQTVRKLARIYAEHPDFDPEWIPQR